MAVEEAGSGPVVAAMSFCAVVDAPESGRTLALNVPLCLTKASISGVGSETGLIHPMDGTGGAEKSLRNR